MKRSPMKSRSRSIRPQMVVSASQALSSYVRKRDEGKPCISCGEYKPLQAGHYLSVGARPELRFHAENVHGQCSRCNIDLAGNRNAFYFGLVERYGLEYVDRLDCYNTTKKTTIDDLKELTKQYNEAEKML